MKNEEPYSFSRVDAVENAESLVGFLDATATAHFESINRRSFELLNLGEGQKVLDVGCGTGDDVRMLQRMVSPGGQATGIDASEKMVATALARDSNSSCRSHFQQAEAENLPFSDNIFDACRVSRVLVHINDPAKALSEMVRVVKPGGRIVGIEPDFDTLVIAPGDKKVTRQVVHEFCDSFANGSVGRYLLGWFRQLGLSRIIVEPQAPCIDLRFLLDSFQLGRVLEQLQHADLISEDDSRSWLGDLHRSVQAGKFFSTATVFLVSGTKQ